MMPKQISGFQNEFNIAKSLDGKTLEMLDPNFQNFISRLFDNSLEPNSVIHAKIDMNRKKYDMIIKINHTIKRISIKKGINNSVHVEGISSFIHFLIDSGIPRDVIIEYLKYHYADGTTNGRGNNRISIEEYKQQHQEKIDYINTKINTPYVLERAINRFILQGKNSNIFIDAILYGTENDFFFLTSSEIKKVILEQIDLYSTAVHFGPLYCQPLARCLNHNPKYEKKRFCVQIKWYSIFDDIIRFKNNEIMRKNEFSIRNSHLI